MNASTSERERALQSLADRVRSRDADIRASVQVASQPVTGKGKLQSIPFGVKDIIETRGLATDLRVAFVAERTASMVSRPAERVSEVDLVGGDPDGKSSPSRSPHRAVIATTATEWGSRSMA